MKLISALVKEFKAYIKLNLALPKEIDAYI